MEMAPTNIAESLLKINALKVDIAQPFQWSSGWTSPLYCDNRMTLSYPALRSEICRQLCQLIQSEFQGITGVAGVVTAGLPMGALIADRLGLPFIYVRPEPKKHGRGKQVEGRLEPELNYVMVEDLISTGKSSLKASQAVLEAGGKVGGCVSIVNYGFPQAADAFAQAQIPVGSLVNLDQILEKAIEMNYIAAQNRAVLDTWRRDPANWSPPVPTDQ